MASLSQKIESILFVASQPLSLKRLAELLAARKEAVEEELEALSGEYAKRNGGMQILRNGEQFQMVTSPECSKLVAEYVREEETGELTRPQLESLTVIAYRGPVAKAELDAIRGVNSALILRNLMIRGLIEEKEDKKLGVPKYTISMDFLRFLGLRQVEELPDYERLRGERTIEDILTQMKEGEAGGGGGKEL